MKEYYKDYRFEDGVVFARLSGEYPNELLQQGENLFKPLVEVCSTHKCKRAVIDARDLQVNFDTMAIFQAGEDAAFTTRAGYRIAVITNEGMIDPFFENVAFNRGGNIGIFTEMDAALAWLKR